MKFLDFREIDSRGRKTNIWVVVSKKNNEPLGYIEWYSPWRRYVFHPIEGTIFDKNCLDEIISFLDEEMKEKNG